MAGSLGRLVETRATSEWLWSQAGKFSNEWKEEGRLTASEIPLPVPRRKGLVPKESQIEGVFLSFVFESGDSGHFPKQADFQVLVRGSLYGYSAIFELEDHWRVDTHLESDDEECEAPREVHPKYHFQRGGHAQDRFAASEIFVPGDVKGLDGEWRGLLQTEWPRMPALPMDPILAIDFCIGQTDGLVWRRLRNESEYYGVVEDAQKRVWLPFFHGLSDAEVRRQWLGELAMQM